MRKSCKLKMMDLKEWCVNNWKFIKWPIELIAVRINHNYTWLFLLYRNGSNYLTHSLSATLSVDGELTHFLNLFY